MIERSFISRHLLISFSAQITSFTAEYQEQTEKLDQLKHRLEEHKSQKHEISVALAAARRECEQSKGFTKSEAFALERE
jgi:cell division septum initiation protein DivIVA